MSVDLFPVAGLAIMALAAGVVGIRLIRDENSLRRKRVLAEKY